MWGYGLRISEVLDIRLKDTYNDELRIIGKGKKHISQSNLWAGIIGSILDLCSHRSFHSHTI